MRIALAFDIETTGRHLPTENGHGDALISIGWCGGYLVAGQPRIEVGPARLDVDLGKPAGTSWGKYWKLREWDGTCFDRFWGTREAELDVLQMGPLVDIKEAMRRLNGVLAELEERYDIVPIVDAHFDSIWLSHLLEQHGYEGLDHTRFGCSRRCLDSYSFQLGRLGLGYPDALPGHQRGSPRAREAFGDLELATNGYIHPHLPDGDAKGILSLFLEAHNR